MSQDICSVIGIWLVCAMASERIAEIITTGEIFARLRSEIAKRANPIIPPQAEEVQVEPKSTTLWVYLYKLVTCGLCMSFWSSLILTPAIPPVTQFMMLDIIIKPFALMLFANIVHSVFIIISRGRVATYDILLKVEDNDRGT